ncbi:MAG: hypothetical protein E3J21_07260 [Anaerolineales bacterium]|nr:MAG: hypothetical protein E3J21_07260 [Anaerolineales bacterium]
MTFFSRVVGIVLAIATLLQGTHAGLSLLDRWRKSRAKASRGTGVDRPAKRLFGVHIKLTQRLVMRLMVGLFYYLFIIFFGAEPMYRYFSSVLPLYDTVVLMAGYLGFAVLYPWMMAAAKSGSKRLLNFMLAIAGINIGLANGMPGFSQAKWYPHIFAITNSVSLTVFRSALMLYLVKEYLLPWFLSLPEE